MSWSLTIAASEKPSGALSALGMASAMNANKAQAVRALRIVGPIGWPRGLTTTVYHCFFCILLNLWSE